MELGLVTHTDQENVVEHTQHWRSPAFFVLLELSILLHGSLILLERVAMEKAQEENTPQKEPCTDVLLMAGS